MFTLLVPWIEESTDGSYVSNSFSSMSLREAEDPGASADSLSRPFLVRVNRESKPSARPPEQKRDVRAVTKAQKVGNRACDVTEYRNVVTFAC